MLGGFVKHRDFILDTAANTLGKAESDDYNEIEQQSMVNVGHLIPFIVTYGK